jgi:hypothetical protein
MGPEEIEAVIRASGWAYYNIQKPWKTAVISSGSIVSRVVQFCRTKIGKKHILTPHSKFKKKQEDSGSTDQEMGGF